MNQVTQYAPPLGMAEMEKMAYAIAQSEMFGIKTAEQALVLMAIAQAEGRPAALAARDYHIIQNKPAKKSEAYMRDFICAGGSVEWHALDDTVADATFTHPQGGCVRIVWTIEKARMIMVEEWTGPRDNRSKKMSPLTDKLNWKNYPRRMLSARCIAEGVRTVCPIATSGLPSTDELADELPPEKDVTPPEERPALPAAVTLAAVEQAYRDATDVPSFQRAREMAAKLPEKDKAAARMNDSETLRRLKGGEANHAHAGALATDTDPKAAQPGQSEAGPSVTLAKLIDAMKSRTALDMLDADADLMQYLPADQQTEAAAEYHRLRAKHV